MKTEFKDKALSVEEILSMLEGQGLIIEDKERARHILTNVSYSRLKNYLVSLMSERKTHRFKVGATFEHAYALYGFDRRLRELAFHEIEKIEISIRTHIAYASNGSENGYWFLNPEHFKSNKGQAYILRKLKNELERSDNEGIKSFYEKYTNEYPPCWLMLEAASMGTLSIMYENMKPGGLKGKVAEKFGLTDTVFASWLHHLVSVRNHCAHHYRFWNNSLNVKAMIPYWTERPFPEFTESDQENIYMTMCVIKYLINYIKPSNTFTQRLKELIDNFPLIDPSLMGFPADWTSHPLWASK